MNFIQNVSEILTLPYFESEANKTYHRANLEFSPSNLDSSSDTTYLIDFFIGELFKAIRENFKDIYEVKEANTANPYAPNTKHVDVKHLIIKKKIDEMTIIKMRSAIQEFFYKLSTFQIITNGVKDLIKKIGIIEIKKLNGEEFLNHESHVISHFLMNKFYKKDYMGLQGYCFKMGLLHHPHTAYTIYITTSNPMSMNSKEINDMTKAFKDRVASNFKSICDEVYFTFNKKRFQTTKLALSEQKLA